MPSFIFAGRSTKLDCRGGSAASAERPKIPAAPNDRPAAFKNSRRSMFINHKFHVTRERSNPVGGGLLIETRSPPVPSFCFSAARGEGILMPHLQIAAVLRPRAVFATPRRRKTKR